MRTRLAVVCSAGFSLLRVDDTKEAKQSNTTTTKHSQDGKPKSVSVARVLIVLDSDVHCWHGLDVGLAALFSPRDVFLVLKPT